MWIIDLQAGLWSIAVAKPGALLWIIDLPEGGLAVLAETRLAKTKMPLTCSETYGEHPGHGERLQQGRRRAGLGGVLRLGVPDSPAAGDGPSGSEKKTPRRFSKRTFKIGRIHQARLTRNKSSGRSDGRGRKSEP